MSSREADKPLLPFDSPEGDDDAGHLRRLSAVKALTNGEIADKLEAFAALLDLSGAGYYTSRAYRRAAETIRETRAPIAELAAAGRAQELRGIGAGISARLKELVDTGRIAELDELESDVRAATSSGWAACSASGRSAWWRSAGHSASPLPTSSARLRARAG